MKRFLSFLLLVLFLGFLLFFPGQSLVYAKNGLLLWFYTLLPSLLPFMILSGLLLELNLLEKILAPLKCFWRAAFGLSCQSAYALLLGVFCGYPMGAKITGDLYRSGQISRQEALYLLTFVNHPGPSFLSAYLCVGLFHMPRLIFPVYGILYASSFGTSLIFRFLLSQKRSSRLLAASLSQAEEKAPRSPAFGESLDASILNSFESIARLGGYIILFSILQGMCSLLLSPFPAVHRIFAGLLEITTGLSFLLQGTEPSLALLPAALAFTSFGGLCVAAQTRSMLLGTSLPLKPYLEGKAVSALLTLGLSYLFFVVIKIV